MNLGLGEIRCRLLGGEAQLLGHWISKRVTDTYRPSFVISKSGQSLDSTKIVISEETLEKLTKKGLFSVPFEFEPEEEAEAVIRLCLSEEPQDWFMISGFPKRLCKSVLSGMSFLVYKSYPIAFIANLCWSPQRRSSISEENNAIDS